MLDLLLHSRPGYVNYMKVISEDHSFLISEILIKP